MLSEHHDEDTQIAPLYGTRAMVDPIPKWQLSEREMPAAAAYQIVHDELALDGNPLLNLASFVTTWMDPEAEKLMVEAMPKNFVDAPEYPQTAELERRCVSIIADLFNADATGDTAVGTSTIGSSEAVHLAGLALKWNWRKRREAAGKPTTQPNIVTGSNVQVVWEKFARYFDVELRFVNMTPERTIIGVPEAKALIDENTIAVVGILGSTSADTNQYSRAGFNPRLCHKSQNARIYDCPLISLYHTYTIKCLEAVTSRRAVTVSRGDYMGGSYLLSGCSITGRLLRRLVDLLRSQQDGSLARHGSAGIDHQPKGCNAHIVRCLGNNVGIGLAERIVEGFQRSTHRFDRLLDLVASARAPLFEKSF